MGTLALVIESSPCRFRYTIFSAAGVGLRRGVNKTMTKAVVRRRQFCARCGQLMFEFYRSPDGHFGLVGEVESVISRRGLEFRCPTCTARYRLLERADAAGQPVVRVLASK